jgi:hypothetical protein
MSKVEDTLQSPEQIADHLIEATLAPHPHLMPGMTAFITIVK